MTWPPRFAIGFAQLKMIASSFCLPSRFFGYGLVLSSWSALKGFLEALQGSGERRSHQGLVASQKVRKDVKRLFCCFQNHFLNDFIEPT